MVCLGGRLTGWISGAGRGGPGSWCAACSSHHRLSTAPGEGALADPAAETAAALARTHGAQPLAVAPAFR